MVSDHEFLAARLLAMLAQKLAGRQFDGDTGIEVGPALKAAFGKLLIGGERLEFAKNGFKFGECGVRKLRRTGIGVNQDGAAGGDILLERLTFGGG